MGLDHGLEVVDLLPGAPLGGLVRRAGGARGRRRVVGGATDRARGADGQLAGDLGSHAVEPALADLHQGLAGDQSLLRDVVQRCLCLAQRHGQGVCLVRGRQAGGQRAEQCLDRLDPRRGATSGLVPLPQAGELAGHSLQPQGDGPEVGTRGLEGAGGHHPLAFDLQGGGLEGLDAGDLDQQGGGLAPSLGDPDVVDDVLTHQLGQ